MSTKETVFSTLSSNIDSPVSGESLAEKCGVSRAAIWKAINSLRQEGFVIEGTTNGGYVLHQDKDIFSKSIFSEYYAEHFPQLCQDKIQFFQEIDSTNNYAKKLLMDTSDYSTLDGTVIMADSQTAGRGRLGRQFVSPQGTGIYVSLIYSPKAMALAPTWISVYTAVAICRGIKKMYGIEPKVKWINDIFFGGKKICGILTEGVVGFESGTIESAVIGFGLNINENEKAFSGELKNIVGSICGSGNSSVKRCDLAAELAGEVFSIFEESPADVIEEYRELCFLKGMEVTVRDVSGATEDYQAQVLDVTDDAHLLVKSKDGNIKELSTGEVSIKLY